MIKKQLYILLFLCSFITVHAEGIDRGIRKTTFIPKGQWMLGGTFSYSEHTDDDYRNIVLTDVNSDGYTFKASPFFGYFFRNNIAVGGRLAYTRSYTNIESITLDLGEDLDITIDNASSLEQMISGTGFIRTYIGIGNSKIFGLFNEARVTYGYGRGKLLSGAGKDLEGTYQVINNLQIGMSPGLTAFVSDFAAVEVSVGLMGFNFKWVDQKTDQVEMGSRNTSSGNFKIDLLSINLGMSFFF